MVEWCSLPFIWLNFLIPLLADLHSMPAECMISWVSHTLCRPSSIVSVAILIASIWHKFIPQALCPIDWKVFCIVLWNLAVAMQKPNLKHSRGVLFDSFCFYRGIWQNAEVTTTLLQHLDMSKRKRLVLIFCMLTFHITAAKEMQVAP